jgi:transposase
VWVYGAVEPSQGTCHVLLLPRVTGEWLERFLAFVRQESGPGQIGVVRDNAPSHKKQALVWPAGMHPIYLPPYSPELNPAEQVVRMLRQRLANGSLEEWETVLSAALQLYWEQPEIVIRLTNYPWWRQAASALMPPSP